MVTISSPAVANVAPRIELPPKVKPGTAIEIVLTGFPASTTPGRSTVGEAP